MEIRFTFEEAEIQRAVRKFARNELLPAWREVNDHGVLPEPLKKKFLSMGLLSSPFPPDYGGAGGSFTGLVLALKELSYATLVPSWMLFENFMLAYPVFQYGTEFLKTTYLPGLISLQTVGALAFTETETGSDPAQIRTAAVKSNDGWLINGAKRFITYSGICDYMILFAKTENHLSAFLVDSSKEGYRVGKRESFIHEKAFDNGDVYFEGYFAPHDHVIGDIGQGFEILLETEKMGKIAFCALFVGMAERALDLSLSYANTKTHRGKPMGQKFQMTQKNLADMMVKTEAMKAHLFQVCAKVDQGEDVLMDAAVLKVQVAEGIREIAARAMEVHGAYGLSEEYDVAEIYRKAISAQAVMGGLDIQRVIMAKGLLDKGRYT